MSAAAVANPPPAIPPPYPRIGIRPAIDGRRRGVRESLEGQTLAMARAAARLMSGRLRQPDGSPVECVVADRCIGGVAEAAAADEQFVRAGVGLTLTVTPCWCYGSETMDMDPLRPKAVWGFNGTERPGAVYLAAVLAAHNQKGLPAFGIYGRDVQEAGDGTIPADVEEKLLRFARAGLAAALLRGRSYLSLGGVSMGIAGSIVDHGFFERYLGLRVDSVDMSEFVRRMEEGIYDPDEFRRALGWVKRWCREGADLNPAGQRKSAAERARDWETVVRMTLIARDLMAGNPRLEALGYGEEAMGRHAIAAGFQGQRAWTDHFPNGDFMEAILNSSFDWNGRRAPYILATENDCLNGVGMLFGHLLTHTAQIFADVRTYWSPAGTDPSHQLRRRRARRHGGAAPRRPAGAQAVLGDHRRRGRPLPARHDVAAGHPRVLPGRRLLLVLPVARRHAPDHEPAEPPGRRRPRAPDRRGFVRRPAGGDAPHAEPSHQRDLAHDVVRAAADRARRLPRRLRRHERVERQSRLRLLWARGRRPRRPRLDAAHPRRPSQRARGGSLPPVGLEPAGNGGPRGRGLPRLRPVRPALRLNPAGRDPDAHPAGAGASRSSSTGCADPDAPPVRVPDGMQPAPRRGRPPASAGGVAPAGGRAGRSRGRGLSGGTAAL
jgi:L-fucose isomerase-like protein